MKAKKRLIKTVERQTNIFDLYVFSYLEKIGEIGIFGRVLPH